MSSTTIFQHNINDGQIILLNSMAGHRVVSTSGLHFYSATKFAVSSLLEGFRQEIQALGTNIRITGISPGVVETGIHERLFGADQARQMYSEQKCLQPEDLADMVRNILRAPEHVQVHDILVRPTRQWY